MTFRSWLLLLVVGSAANLEQCSSSSLCDNSVERGIISSSSGTVLVDTSLPVDPVCIRCGYQDQLYTDPAIVTYYYNGAVIVNDTIGSVWVTDEGLIIQDPAVYFDHIICSFVPINESMARSNEIDIIFFASAKVLSFTPDNSTVVAGNTLTLNCKFEGDPLPSVLWSHNKTILNVSADPNLSETLLESYALLDVTFTDINDTGVYMCMVNNSFSFDQSNPSDFIVQVAPSPVISFQTDFKSDKCVILSWMFGFDGNAPIVGIDIIYNATQNNFKPQSDTIHIASPTRTSIGICDLQPLTTYEFTIHVQNQISDKVGVSLPVHLSSATLSAKPDPPELILVEAISSEELIVNWTANYSSHTQDHITDFEIYYNVLNESSIMTCYVTDGLATSQVLSGLEHGMLYEITMVCINIAGYSSPSNTVRHRTKPHSKRNAFSETNLVISVTGGALIVLVIVCVVVPCMITFYMGYKQKKQTQEDEQSLDSDNSHLISPSSCSNESVVSKDDHAITSKHQDADNMEIEAVIGQFSRIEFDQRGLFYHSEEHGVTVIIPENAVKSHSSIIIQVSRFWPNFKCADEGYYEPVSPFVYIYTDDELSEFAQVYIPHYVDRDNGSIKNLKVLVKGHKPNCMFEVLQDVEVEVQQTVVCMKMKNFCVLCLADVHDGEQLQRRYQVVSAEKTTDEHSKDVQICILYSITCFRRIQKYYLKKGYTIKMTEEIKGDICQEGVSVSGVKITKEKWTHFEVGRTGKKITAEDVDMFKILGCTPYTMTERKKKTLEALEDEGQYPPRFHLQFDNETHQNTDTSCPVTITLTGFVSDISFKIVLGEKLGEKNQLSQANAKDSFLIELMPFIEPILCDSIQTYYQFGTQLGLTIDQLTQLEYRFPDTERCIMQILLKWRDNSQSVSHHEISQALRTCGYPILSVILHNRFSINEDIEAADGDVAVVVKPVNGCKIIQEKFNEGGIILQQKPSDAELNRHVVPFIASKWRLFGRQVGIGGTALDTIEGNHHGQCQICFNKVIDQWKKNDSRLYPFTWETVLSVIYSDTVRGYNAGEQVYQHLMHTHQKHNTGPNPDYIVKTKAPRLSSSL